MKEKITKPLTVYWIKSHEKNHGKSHEKSHGLFKPLFKSLGQTKAQVIVEYILLLVVSTVIALLLINLVSVDPEKSSPVFNYWKHLLQAIGQDVST